MSEREREREREREQAIKEVARPMRNCWQN